MQLTIEADLDYALPTSATVSLQLEAANTPDQRVLESSLEIPDLPAPHWVPACGGVGRRAWVEAVDTLKCRYRATVELHRPTSDIRKAPFVPFAQLPADAIAYLMASRYCQSDMFEQFVTSEFGHYAGGEKVAAIRDWIELSCSYVRGSSDETTTAIDTFVTRQGVCRDYAHILISLARAAHIPARAVAVYAPDVSPPDFHAVAEVYVGDAWHLVDATGMSQPDTLAKIVVGHDAADIDFMTTYGPAGQKPSLNEQSVRVARR